MTYKPTPRDLLALRLASYFERYKVAEAEFSAGVTWTALQKLITCQPAVDPYTYAEERNGAKVQGATTRYYNIVYCLQCRTLHSNLPVLVSRATVPVCCECESTTQYATQHNWRYTNPLSILSFGDYD